MWFSHSDMPSRVGMDGHPCLADSSHPIGPHSSVGRAFSSGSSQDPRGLSRAGRVENRISNGAPSGARQGRASVPVRWDGYIRLRVKVVGASLLEGCRPPDGVHTLCTPALPPAAPQPDTFTDTCRCFTSRWRQGMAWPRWSAEQDGDRAHRECCSEAPSSRHLRRPAETEEDIFWSLRTPTDD